MTIIDIINLRGVEFIQFLQEIFPRRGNFFMSVSNYGDPTLMCSLYFPLATALSPTLGITLLWTFIFCEWTNMVLKLLLAGDRPYWWVHESPLFRNKVPPHLHQYSKTCETGAGNPSGHTMLNGAICLVFILALVSWLKKTTLLSKKTRPLIIKTAWAVYGLWLVMVCISRIYIAAHFPHQCIAGVVLGIFTVLFVRKTKVLMTPSRFQAVALSATILATVLSIFALYNKILGFDPMWSLEKAIRWCIRREYIHVDSKPFYSLSRYSGMSLGLGLALTSQYYKRTDTSRFSKLMKLSLVVLTVAVGQFGSFLHKDVFSPNLPGYYFIEFILNTSVTFICVAALPKLVAKACGQLPGAKFKKP